MSAFLSAWSKTGREEGGYANNSNDSGGSTNWGITERIARAHGFEGDMRDLTRDSARLIAKSQYWDLMRLDDVAELSVPIAEEMFDTGFNAGQATVVKFLQRFLNVANRQKRDYPDMLVDGLMGRVSVATLATYLSSRGAAGEVVALRALNCLQGAFYIELAERREKDEEFLFGWLLNRVQMGDRDDL